MKRIGSHLVTIGLFLCSLLVLWVMDLLPPWGIISGALALIGFASAISASAISRVQTPAIRVFAYLFYGAMIIFIAITVLYFHVPSV